MMVLSIYDRPVIWDPEVTTIIPDFHFNNILAILDPIKETRPVVEETQYEIRERNKRKCEKKYVTKKDKEDSLQDD